MNSTAVLVRRLIYCGDDQEMNALETERNMLFGMLAAQLDFISQGQFLTAVAAWRRQSSKPLIEILRDQDSLTDKDLLLLNDLVEAHVKRHHNDVTKSLGTLTLPHTVRDELSKATDTEIEQTLSIIGSDTIEGNGDESILMPNSGSGCNATQMGSAIGTPAFMSPEQAAGQIDRLDSATDIYSLGATLYYLLTGQTPISGKDSSN